MHYLTGDPVVLRSKDVSRVMGLCDNKRPVVRWLKRGLLRGLHQSWTVCNDDLISKFVHAIVKGCCCGLGSLSLCCGAFRSHGRSFQILEFSSDCRDVAAKFGIRGYKARLNSVHKLVWRRVNLGGPTKVAVDGLSDLALPVDSTTRHEAPKALLQRPDHLLGATIGRWCVGKDHLPPDAIGFHKDLQGSGREAAGVATDNGFRRSERCDDFFSYEVHHHFSRRRAGELRNRQTRQVLDRN